MDIDLKQLKDLMRAVKQFDIQELEIEREGQRIKLCRGQKEATAVAVAPASMPAPVAAAAPAPAAAATAAATPAETEDADVHWITSPFVGTFYEAPSPEAAAFVKVGATIEPGQALCIVEAMKLMNEIEADVRGTILEVVAENGKPVEYGDRLFKVKKS